MFLSTATLMLNGRGRPHSREGSTPLVRQAEQRTQLQQQQQQQQQASNPKGLACVLCCCLGVVAQVDPLMASRMATWVVWGVINWQRKMDAYAEAQTRCVRAGALVAAAAAQGSRLLHLCVMAIARGGGGGLGSPRNAEGRGPAGLVELTRSN
jgi:hypothetical protein